MVMNPCVGMGDSVLRERLPTLWRRIEDAHYSYLEIDDSPEKLRQKKKLEGYILEYLTLVPHECKFGLAETGKVFQRTINELQDFSAYRAGIGWAAVARYAGNLLAQPWRKEYRVIRLYSGFYKHEVESNMVGGESMLQAMGYRAAGAGRFALDGPVCPDMAAAISRDAIIAHCECQIMSQIWEAVWSGGTRVSWAEIARERSSHVATVSVAAARLSGYTDDGDIYTNVPASVSDPRRLIEPQYQATPQCHCLEPIEEPVQPVINPYMMPNMVPSHMMYAMNPDMQAMPQCNAVPVMPPYAAVPYYYPIQTPYMIPTPVYAPIKHATTLQVNGFPMPQYRHPSVPTAQLIELEAPSVYENGKFDRHENRSHKKNIQKRYSRSSYIDAPMPSLPRSDTQPALSKAKEDGMGTYESWDYVFRNLSSKEQDGDSRSGFSQSLDRDSRTLDRLDREERRSKYQPATLDLEDGLQALNLDRSYDEQMFRTAKVNENLMRLKLEQEQKKARQLVKKYSEEKRPKKLEAVGNPRADGLVTQKVAPDKIKLLTKKEVKERKDVIKQQSSMNGSVSNAADAKKVKKPTRLGAAEVAKAKKPIENGVHKIGQSSKTINGSASEHSNYELKAQLVVSLDEPDIVRRSPPKNQNGERDRDRERDLERERERERERTRERERVREHGRERETSSSRMSAHDTKPDKWQCGTCTYINKQSLVACEMCGRSKRGPEMEPLTSGGRECPVCTLVNKRDAAACDACAASLRHCPTYI